MRVFRVTVVWSTGARFQYASMVKQSSQDARAVDVINFIDQFVSILQRDPYSKIGKHHHKLTHSGQRKGGYSCGFPSTSNGMMDGLRFTYEVYDVRKGGALDSLPHYVLSHVSADDVVNSDYIVFIQDAAWDYHDAGVDSKRLQHRDSNDLSREEWIFCEYATLRSGGMGEAAARYLAERYYDIHLHKDELDRQVHVPGTPVLV